MDSWDEIRTAFHVARAGTVSGAADRLGVHHATVIRHIDALESRLGVRLFQRHARGYTATDAGQDLLRVAQATDDQFTQLAGRIKGLGEGVTGELIVTSLGEFGPFLAPIVAEFCALHPEVDAQILTDTRVFRLEYGEAHVAIRAGSRPTEPDNVVQPLTKMRMAMVASSDYVARMGKVADEADLARHAFVTHADTDHRAPFYRWLAERAPDARRPFRSTETRVLREAIVAGAGIGFVSEYERAGAPDLVEVYPAQDAWAVDLWIVTHVDLHRSSKVQAFATFLKDRVKEGAS
ncbi:LysR family transcriptional regulator [Salipiger sp. IMCC34102]|uniref:LysR family transcriptional regulator n=1 Tax=Salipiger sp. IMCC34102 TaxID=2510647 RepID=UPI00101DFCB2|nr:LysR family transcriptional regulator [Salipiger sp. IMCC34102]RYH03985.1 LysR family transcriptional regulator [Salipiger sp. IMCC34102]